MKFENILEYRGKSDKVSSQGRSYSTLKFEDEEGDQIPFYCPADKNLTIRSTDLLKGHSYNLRMNYFMNPFDKVFRLELDDILDDVG